ncbi:EAL domain-containing protein [Pseudomonas aeruginosa]|uniref:EAL domain-containing protein n=1 Tax=Pseudomonas aeruginosa TaxID=287 RepID=UPI00106A5052
MKLGNCCRIAGCRPNLRKVSWADAYHKNAAIVRSTLLLCRELGLSVVAEGVETASELQWLQANQCDQAQGFYIGRPMPLEALHAWMTSYHADNVRPHVELRS